MNFDIPAELKALQEKTRRFIAEEIIPFEKDPRVTPHGPTEELRNELVARAKAAEALFGEAAAVKVGRYRLIEPIGGGVGGMVWRCHDDELDAEIAIKLLAIDVDGSAEQEGRLRDEARRARRVTHPNVSRVFEFGSCASHHYLTMEYIPGETLADIFLGRITSWRDPRLLAVRALLEVKRRVAPYLDLQLVAFPQDGVLRAPGALDNLQRALDLGVDVVGGIPHFERTMADGAESVKVLCELAAQRGLRVDMHCDESDDPLSRHIETLAFHTQRLGLQGRVTGSHLTSMHSMDNYYVSKLLPLIAVAGVHAVANPLINITLQGRHDTYPKRRGMTRVPELMDAGVNVAFGQDCVMDPWYALGSGCMLEVAAMGLHVGQMTSQARMRACFDAVTVNAARVLGLPADGLVVGAPADMVLLQARNPVEALRLRATRLLVVRRGQVLARTPAATASLALPGRPGQVDWTLPR